MTIKQAIYDRVRILNKHVTNKILIHFAGTRNAPFTILSHLGRKSGKEYKIPVISVPIENGFVIALTYGKKTDWYENVKAAGGCSIKWKDNEYKLTNPVLIDKEIALKAFPAFVRLALRSARIEYFLRLLK